MRPRPTAAQLRRLRESTPEDLRWILEDREFRGTGRSADPGGYSFAPPERPAGGLQAPSVGIQLLPPTWLRPPKAKDFHLETDAAAPNFTSANTPAVIPGCTFQVPGGYVGVVRSLDLSVNQLVATTDIVWRLRFNQMPVEGWAPLTIFPGNIAAARRSFGPEEMQVPVPEAASVDVEIEVRDGGTYQAGASFGGWIYSRDLDGIFSDAWRS